MNSVNALGLKVVGMTVVALILLWGSALAVRLLFVPDDTAPDTAQAPTPMPQVAAEQAIEDSDSDGLANTLESIYGTDITNPDTDGDGTKDGNEVILGRDPLIAGPNDTGPAGSGALADDTYTAVYLATIPADASRDEVIDKNKLAAFVDENKGNLLPEVPEQDINITDDSSANAIATYLDAISPSTNDAITPVTNTDIEAAFQLSYAQNQPEAMSSIISALEHNIDTFKSLDVPKEVGPLHTKLLGATKGLLNAANLLQGMSGDFVGGLIGAKKIEDLAPVFESIAAQVLVLEDKYNLS